MRVYLIGFMGAGKSHWGKVLSRKLQIPFFDLDDLIEDDAGKSINNIFEDEGEEFFRMKEREILHMLTNTHDSFVLSTGGGAPCYFNNIRYMNEMGITVWLNTPAEILLGRLRQQKAHRPLLKNLDDEQLKAYIVKKNADRRIYYEQAKVKVNNSEINTEDLLNQIFHA